MVHLEDDVAAARGAVGSVAVTSTRTSVVLNAAAPEEHPVLDDMREGNAAGEDDVVRQVLDPRREGHRVAVRVLEHGRRATGDIAALAVVQDRLSRRLGFLRAQLRVLNGPADATDAIMYGGGGAKRHASAARCSSSTSCCSSCPCPRTTTAPCRSRSAPRHLHPVEGARREPRQRRRGRGARVRQAGRLVLQHPVVLVVRVRAPRVVAQVVVRDRARPGVGRRAPAHRQVARARHRGHRRRGRGRGGTVACDEVWSPATLEKLATFRPSASTEILGSGLRVART